LLRRIMAFWPDVKGLRVMGCGYATPYMKALRAGGTERVFAIMQAGQGVHGWPDDGANLVALTDEAELPLETESVDRILLIHGLEHAEFPDALMRELWRILKSNGRILLIVPNRLGLWARADWTPFGHGRPWSMGQIHHFLEDNMFIHERTDRALFMPPFRSFLMLRSAYLIESIGRRVFPGLAGVYIVEAGKQIYAARGKAARNPRRARRILVPEPAAALRRDSDKL
ncbi:MAG: class I SAM-dependent methyltransferase, partial [Alphaproteobacteria bacterium]|nr:class I SAM-dependent methyltransferase [Alphaproteobacteria bacterium]